MTRKDFEIMLKTKNGRGPRTVPHSFGKKKFFNYYRQHRTQEHKYVLTEKEFYKVVNAVTEEFILELFKGVDIMLPHKMGTVRIAKYTPKAYYDRNGKMKNSYSIDWNKTVKLWYDDEEAYNNKTLIRILSKNNYVPTYIKKDAFYANSYYFEMMFNRGFKRRLREYIKANPEFDCAKL